MDYLELSHHHIIAVLTESGALKVSHALSGFLQEHTMGLDQHNQVSRVFFWLHTHQRGLVFLFHFVSEPQGAFPSWRFTWQGRIRLVKI
jgi:hypothetical protein